MREGSLNDEQPPVDPVEEPCSTLVFGPLVVVFSILAPSVTSRWAGSALRTRQLTAGDGHCGGGGDGNEAQRMHIACRARRGRAC